MITTNENILRKNCDDVSNLDEANEIISLLEKELDLSAKRGMIGIGLAANQIGIFKKVAIIRTKNTKLNLVNCKISEKYDPKPFMNEGCLSYPNKTINTIRYSEIFVENNLVEPNSFVSTDLEAVVVQHELDHLEGIIMSDREISKPKLKISPNDPCNCGSGKKYKKCCRK